MRTALTIAAGLVAVIGTAFAWQTRPFREYPGIEYENFPLPKDYQEQTEWVFARLMYPAVLVGGFRGNPDWKHGRANWTIDYPRSDRHMAEAIRRLSRIHARSVEQPVDLDDDDDLEMEEIIVCTLDPEKVRITLLRIQPAFVGSIGLNRKLLKLLCAPELPTDSRFRRRRG